MELLQMFGLEQTGILTGSGCVHLYQSEEDLNWVIYIYTSSWKRMSDIPVLGKEWVIYQFLEKNEWYASSWKRMSDIYQFLEKNEWYIPVLGKEWVIYQFLEKNEWYTCSWKRMSDIYQFLEKNEWYTSSWKRNVFSVWKNGCHRLCFESLHVVNEPVVCYLTAAPCLLWAVLWHINTDENTEATLKCCYALPWQLLCDNMHPSSRNGDEGSFVWQRASIQKWRWRLLCVTACIHQKWRWRLLCVTACIHPPEMEMKAPLCDSVHPSSRNGDEGSFVWQHASIQKWKWRPLCVTACIHPPEMEMKAPLCDSVHPSSRNGNEGSFVWQRASIHQKWRWMLKRWCTAARVAG